MHENIIGDYFNWNRYTYIEYDMNIERYEIYPVKLIEKPRDVE